VSGLSGYQGASYERDFRLESELEEWFLRNNMARLTRAFESYLIGKYGLKRGSWGGCRDLERASERVRRRLKRRLKKSLK